MASCKLVGARYKNNSWLGWTTSSSGWAGYVSNNNKYGAVLKIEVSCGSGYKNVKSITIHIPRWNVGRTNDIWDVSTLYLNAYIYNSDISGGDGSIPSGYLASAQKSHTVQHWDSGEKEDNFTLTFTRTGNFSAGTYYIFIKSTKYNGNLDVIESISIPTTSGYSAVDGDVSYTPTKSSISNASGTIEGSASFSISRSDGVSAGYTHNVVIDGVAVKTGVGVGNYSYTIPDSFYSKIPNAKSGTITITMKTLYNGVDYGDTTATLTYSINESVCKPTATSSYSVDSTTQSLTGSATKAITGISTVSISASGTGNKSATISKVFIDGVERTSYSISNSTKSAYTYYVIDSRGLQSTVGTREIVQVGYNKPTVNLSSSLSLSGVLTINITGSFTNVNFGAQTNTATVQYKIGSGSWTNITNSGTGGNISASANLSGYNANSTYTVQARVVDKLNTITSDVYTVKNKPVWDWDEDDINFNVPMYFQNHNGPIGEYILNPSNVNIWNDTSSSVSIGANAFKNMGGLYLHPGRYVVSVYANFDNNNGGKYVVLQQGTANSNANVGIWQPIPSMSYYGCLTIPVDVSTGGLYPYSVKNGATATNVKAFAIAMRIL